jgi:CubicO group peptidase (beta-lactamase class C family)
MPSTKIAPFVFMLMVAIPCASGAPAEDRRLDSPNTVAAIDALFSKFGDSTPGCALGIYEHNGSYHLAGYGMADLEGKQRITPRSVFGIAAVSRQFTALVMLLALKDRQLPLDSGIRAVLTELPPAFEPVASTSCASSAGGSRDRCWRLTCSPARSPGS